MVRKYSQGRVEVEALRPEIETFLSNGESLRSIHTNLFAQGRISVKLRQFTKVASVIRDEWAARKIRSAVSHTKSLNIDDDRTTVIGEEHIAASAAVVPLSGRSRAAGGFKLNRDFNPEE